MSNCFIVRSNSSSALNKLNLLSYTTHRCSVMTEQYTTRKRMERKSTWKQNNQAYWFTSLLMQSYDRSSVTLFRSDCHHLPSIASRKTQMFHRLLVSNTISFRNATFSIDNCVFPSRIYLAINNRPSIWTALQTTTIAVDFYLNVAMPLKLWVIYIAFLLFRASLEGKGICSASTNSPTSK